MLNPESLSAGNKAAIRPEFLLCFTKVFHQFSGMPSTLAHAASPVVPGLFVVAMALKELDNIHYKFKGGVSPVTSLAFT